MLPKPIRAIFYWILRSGPLGRFIADVISWAFYLMVKIFRIKPKQDVAGLTIISHKYKFIFFGIPKVASRSFYNLFVKDRMQEFDIEWSEKRNGFFEAVEKYPDYYKFSIVRNPWSRILSCYNSKVADNIIGKRARILSFYKGLKGGMSFEAFVEWLGSAEGEDEIADRHWLSQHQFLYDKEGHFLCDYIGRYENLDEDWRIICSEIDIEYLPLPQKGFVSAIGKTNNPNKKNIPTESMKKINYKDFYNEDLKNIIAARYKKDIELFNYEF